MRCRRRISIGLAVVMLIWPLFVWWNISHRVLSQRTVFDVGMTLVVVACILNGLWRVLVGSLLGWLIGLTVFGLKINGNALDDAKSAMNGMIVGTILGYLWHLWQSKASDPAC